MSKKPENLNTIRQSCGSRVVVNGVNSNRETPYAADTFLLSLQVKVFLYYNMKGQFSYICRKPKLCRNTSFTRKTEETLPVTVVINNKKGE